MTAISIIASAPLLAMALVFEDAVEPSDLDGWLMILALARPALIARAA